MTDESLAGFQVPVTFLLGDVVGTSSGRRIHGLQSPGPRFEGAEPVLRAVLRQEHVWGPADGRA